MRETEWVWVNTVARTTGIPRSTLLRAIYSKVLKAKQRMVWVIDPDSLADYVANWPRTPGRPKGSRDGHKRKRLK